MGRTPTIRVIVLSFIVAVLALSRPAHAASQAQCSALKSLALPLTQIKSATWMPATTTAPEHCRAQGIIGPGTIGFVVQLPTDWNGKLYHQGGGGFVGFIPDASAGLVLHYATAATDTGHTGTGGFGGALDATWALNNPQAVVDFGYRAIHVTTSTAKHIIDAYYGRFPVRSYFTGCSRGGGQGLMEAQRFPEDFDGIVVGAPAFHWTEFMMGFNWDSRALAAAPIPASKLPLIAALPTHPMLLDDALTLRGRYKAVGESADSARADEHAMQLNGSTPSPTYSAHENATERFYASLADGFGDFHGRYLNFGLWEDGVTDYVQAAEHLLARVGLAIGLGVDSRVLDAGCGMGAQDQFLVGRFGCSRIEAIDLTAAHIDVARRHNAYEGQVVYSRANACVLPFADASFTHVIGIEAPVHFRTREAFFHEAGRVLAGGGRIGTSDFVRARDPRGPLEEALVRLGAKAWHIPKENADTPELYASKLGAHGFEDVRVERVGKSVIPGYLEENARPEVRRRIRQIRGRVAGRATRVLDWLVGALWRRGLVDYVLTSARKAA